MSGWLDEMLNVGGYATVMAEGTALTQRRTVNVIGGQSYDDAVNQRTIVVIPAGATKPGDSMTLYIDKGGNDTSAERGNAGLPFATIEAALAAAQSGDVVQLGPGTWTISSLAPLEWPDLGRLTLRGAGRDSTTIVGSMSGAAVLTVAPALHGAQIIIADLTIAETGGSACSLAIGDDTYRIASVELRDVRTLSSTDHGIELQSILDLYVAGCRLDKVYAHGVVRATLSDCHCTSVYRFGWDSDDTTLWTSENAVYSDVQTVGCYGAGLTAEGIVRVSADGGCLGALTATLTSDGEEAAGYVTAQSRFNIVAISGDSEFTGANLDGSTMASLAVTRSAGADRIVVTARGGSIAGGVSAGEGCDLDIRGSHFLQASLEAVGSPIGGHKGTIERSTHREAFNLPDGGTTVALAVPFTTANYSVAYELTTGSGAPVYTTSKTATGFAVGYIGDTDSAASFLILHD